MLQYLLTPWEPGPHIPDSRFPSGAPLLSCYRCHSPWERLQWILTYVPWWTS
jgi:hypothetical protein